MHLCFYDSLQTAFKCIFEELIHFKSHRFDYRANSVKVWGDYLTDTSESFDCRMRLLPTECLDWGELGFIRFSNQLFDKTVSCCGHRMRFGISSCFISSAYEFNSGDLYQEREWPQDIRFSLRIHFLLKTGSR